MNTTLATKAIDAVTDPAFESEDGYCQRFARQIVQSVYGAKYDRYHKASARESALAWLAAGFGVRSSDASKLQEGDLIYKTTGSGDFGHVGIVTARGIAENSSTSLGRLQGAKGYRSLEQFGHFDVVVRLPDPKATANLDAPSAAPSASSTSLPLGVPPTSGVSPGNPTFKAFFNDVEIRGAVYDAQSHQVWAPVRATLAAAGIDILAYGDHAAGKNRVYTWGRKQTKA